MNDDDQIDQPYACKLPSGTGAALEPLFRWHGMAVYPVFGAEGDDDGDGDPDSEPGGEEDQDTGDGTEVDGSGTVSRDDFDRLKAQLAAADKNRSKAEAELKKINDGKKDELTKATERVSELEKAQAEASATIVQMRLENAFLTATPGITWHDPADALALAERQGYLAEVVGEDGKVDNGKLTQKLKELAKAKPHLVKSGSESQADKTKEKIPPTGSKVGSKGAQKDGEPDLSRYNRLLNR